MFQQMGFGVAVALLLDATVIRSVVLPAAMRLLGALELVPAALARVAAAHRGRGPAGSRSLRHGRVDGSTAYEPPRLGNALEHALAPVCEREPAACDEVLTVLGDDDLASGRGPEDLAPIVTARPMGLPSAISHSPMCTAARVSIPSSPTRSAISRAQ